MASMVISPANLIRGSLSLMTALAWNGFVRESTTYLYPNSKNKLFAELLYAVIITIVVILVVYSFNYVSNGFTESLIDKPLYHGESMLSGDTNGGFIF